MMIRHSRPIPEAALALRGRAAAAARVLVLGASWLVCVAGVQATTPLADQPLFTNTAVPGNLVLPLSVEFPTAISVAHTGAYVDGATDRPYLGYFDPNKCYVYVWNADEKLRHFALAGAATARRCTGTQDDKWSGNFLNWATTQTIDPFRSALTGGYRVVDTVSETILEKAWAPTLPGCGGDCQGSDANFPNKSINSTVAAYTTPFTSALNMRIRTLGNKMRFTGTGTLTNAPTVFDGSFTAATVYEVSVRVKVCDASPAAGGVEANCKQYPAGSWKPEGLLQQYAEKIRFSAFGYLNDPSDSNRDGGVLRARQKFIGPQRITPGQLPTSNPAREWDPSTGIQVVNPDAADAAATAATAAFYGVTVGNSGVLNYINKFGQEQGTFKRRDPVSELYYGALRYLKNQGHVPAWSEIGTDPNKVRLIDGFPVIRDWGDPVQYSCQRNFILGIGDTNTNWDRNLPGTTGGSEPAKPPEVTADTTVNALTATNKVGSLQGLGASLGTTGISNGSYLIAGLAYDANTVDIRPDLTGRQTVQTYWMDVLEFGNYAATNQYYLAAKFGGLRVPEGFNPYTFAGPIPQDWWRTNTDTVGGQPRPDNYFTAARPDQVIDGLTRAFASIAAQLSAFTTSFSTGLPQVSTAGNASYSAQFDSDNWTGEVTASELSFSTSNGTPSQTTAWTFSTRLAAQLAGTGWDTARRVATWNPTTGAGVSFRHASLTPAQKTALDAPWRTGDDSADVLNWLRGQRLHEVGSTATGSSQAYRARTALLGDVVGSKARPVGRPSMPYGNASNPGYGAFKAARSTRPTMVYVGSNGGMLHAIDGRLTGTGAGSEVFAYVPAALFAGPTGAAATDGLVALTNPGYQHRYYVNATPAVFDIDFGRTPGGGGTDWRTVLIGGLGKGGRAIYALDITDPESMTTEAAVASKVLWEFTDADLGYTFGEPLVVKTLKYGWVVIIGSGYNNADGQGRFFIINPRTGALLEKITTGSGTSGAQAGLAHVNAFVLDRTDGTVDAAYAGDLQGNVWRLDLTATTGPYPAPVKLAELRSGSGDAQPVTTRPLIEVDPQSGRRFVLVGTGRMLDTTDIGSTVQQSFYAIVDGKATRFGTAAEVPGGGGFPVRRAQLADNTDLTDTVSFNPVTQAGWRVELGNGGGAGLGWRVTSDPSSAFGIVTFASTLPSGDVCNPSGSTRIYGISLASGRSVLTDGTTTLINYSGALSSVVTDLRFYSIDGTPRLIAGSDTGQLAPIPGLFTPPRNVRRLNWRELPTAN